MSARVARGSIRGAEREPGNCRLNGGTWVLAQLGDRWVSSGALGGGFGGSRPSSNTVRGRKVVPDKTRKARTLILSPLLKRVSQIVPRSNNALDSSQTGPRGDDFPQLFCLQPSATFPPKDPRQGLRPANPSGARAASRSVKTKKKNSPEERGPAAGCMVQGTRSARPRSRGGLSG